MVVAEWSKTQESGDVAVFRGRVLLKNVQFERMSQSGTTHGAVRFLFSKHYESMVHKCAFYNHYSLALFVYKADNIKFKDNFIYKTTRNAIVIRGTNKLDLAQNLIVANEARNWNN